MPSTGSDSPPVDSQSGWPRRYGLPSWMRSNIDRLGTSTNFEEYACSPPETDSGFIPDLDVKMSVSEYSEQPEFHISSLKTSRSAPTLCDMERSAQQHELSKALKEATRQSFLANSAALAVPHILGCQSASTSTETTPSSTPQSSPFNVRKNLRKDDQTSPGTGKKWFYPGVLMEQTGENLPVLKENPGVASPVIIKKKDRQNKVVLATKNYKKYMVSNFDLNAVSPTSW